MNSEHWKRIGELFHQALERPRAEQIAFLEAACAGDRELFHDVEALLYHDALGTGDLDESLSQVASDLLEGSGLPPAAGPYRILRLLDEGGMGAVYLAEQQDLRRPVAIKVLRDGWLSPFRRERFEFERNTLAQLTHPLIARIYDGGAFADGTPYFVMEYVDGPPITTYCVEKSCPIRERLALYRQACEAVLYAHQRGYIHRDLKPSNILMRSDGTPRLLDFGIAKQLEGERAADRTRTALRMATPAYAAPEQLLGQPAGVFTDVYGLGVVLYELLTDRPPFESSKESAPPIELMILEREPAAPSTVRRLEGLTRSDWTDLDVICATATHKEPGKRYSSVDALIRDIDHFLRHEPLEARPDSAGYKLKKFVRRRRAAVSFAAATVAIVFALVLFFTVRLARARDEAVTALARLERIQAFTLSLFQGDEAAGPARDLRVVDMLQRGIREAEGMQSEPGMQSDLYHTLGGILRMMGDFGQSDTMLRKALERRRSTLGNDHPEVSSTLTALALLRIDQARYDEAISLANEGIALARRHGGKAVKEHAEALAVLGKALQMSGNNKEAVTVLKTAMEMHRGPHTPESSATVTELANTYFYLGNYAESEKLNLRALALNKALFGDRHPFVSDDLINLGAIAHERGQLAEAERYYRAGLAITGDWYGPDHIRTAGNLSMLARVLVAQNRFDEAAEPLRRALFIREQKLGRNHPRVANVILDLGNVAMKSGRLDEAEAHFRRGVRIYRAAYGDGHSFMGIALSNLANALTEKRQYREAERLLHQALAIYEATLPPGHQNVAVTRMRLGRVLLRQERFAEAEPMSSAAYGILREKPTKINAVWLEAAAKDLTEIYTRLNQPDRVATIHREVAASRP